MDNMMLAQLLRDMQVRNDDVDGHNDDKREKIDTWIFGRRLRRMGMVVVGGIEMVPFSPVRYLRRECF
jgi:hypothetical protein